MDTIKRLAAGTCPLVATDIFTATVKTSVVAADVANPTGTMQGVTLKLNGVILFDVGVPAGGTLSWHGPQVIEAGEKINIVADSASCEYNITGVETT